jgi:hypothetical protein
LADSHERKCEVKPDVETAAASCVASSSAGTSLTTSTGSVPSPQPADSRDRVPSKDSEERRLIMVLSFDGGITRSEQEQAREPLYGFSL